MTADFAHKFINLAQPVLGAAVVHATDDFFADKARLILPKPPVWVDDLYDDHGKWMDGWESRRKRGNGHDHCTVKLGAKGFIEGVDIDTSHFTGNYAPAASLQACVSDKENPGDKAAWVEILPPTPLKGNDHNFLPVGNEKVWTHVRLHIYPDGGVARLRVYGRVAKDWTKVKKTEAVDLLAMENGGRLLCASDAHYGSPVNVTKPGKGENMGDAWETRRRRSPGFDWAIFELGHKGIIREILVDTAYHKGNYPESCSIQAMDMPDADGATIAAQALYWPDVLPESKLGPHREHRFKKELKNTGGVTHIRVNMIPDGGISRLRIFGTLA
jgi:allantoicase